MPHCPRCKGAIPIRKIFSWTGGTGVRCPKCDAWLEAVRWRLGLANGVGTVSGMSAGSLLGITAFPLRMAAFALAYMLIWPAAYLLLARFRVAPLSVLGTRTFFR